MMKSMERSSKEWTTTCLCFTRRQEI